MRILTGFILLLTAFGVQAQSCQQSSLGGLGVQEEIHDLPDWELVTFSFRRTPIGPFGVDCEIDVLLNGPEPRAGLFEGVVIAQDADHSSTSITRELAITPSLHAGDEATVYELQMESVNGVASELLVRVVAETDFDEGTVYVLHAVHLPQQAAPSVRVLVQAPYSGQGEGLPCLGGNATICLSTHWDQRSQSVVARLAVDPGSVHEESVHDAHALPAMRMGHLGARHNSRKFAGIRLRHKVCELDGDALTASCQQDRF